jgi:septum formation protein
MLLGSASPRRRQLLETVGLPLVVTTVEVDESPRSGEGPAAYLRRVVATKHAAVRDRWDQAQRSAADGATELAACAALLVADTVVVRDGHIMGKPRHDAHARAMLGELAGTEHQVMTRFVVDAPEVTGCPHAETVTTRVWFRALEEAQLERYVETGEGQDKAGGYAIQGVGSLLVERIEGSYANVVGLPLCAVVTALQSLGLVGPLPLRSEA